ncbi:MAG: DNA primase [Pelotomaculum sp. PtaU1.Bin065]|nr:MAG: DNA primase [Pelotomaculum sp. PtaU1.Bin065]
MDNYTISEIKTKIDLVELISEDTPLTQHGHNFVGSHNNKHDSKSGTCLSVDPDAGDGGLYYCFHCGEGGDCFSWVINNRGMAFPEALQYLAQKAGVPLPEMDEETRQEYQRLYNDRRDLPPLLMAAADFYHSQLRGEHYQDMSKRWGLTKETIKRFKIGYAPLDRTLLVKHLGSLGFSRELMAKSGLFWVKNNKLSSIFYGRIIIPYWRNNQIVYMIGRWFPGCPDDEKVKKYQKQLVSKNHPFVSPAISNEYLYGEDSVRGAKELLITEGVADCLMALQAGFNCISPVTVRFRKTDYPKILQLVRRVEQVYICNDQEDNHAGENGALDTAAFLETNGITVRLVTLPRPEGVFKVDLAEYLRDNPVGAFRGLMAGARSCWEIKVDRLSVPANRVEAIRTIQNFVKKDLVNCDSLVANTIIKFNLKQKFNLDSTEVKELLKVRGTAVKEAEKKKEEGEKEDKRTQSDILIELALSAATLFHDEQKEPFARFYVSDHFEIWPVRNKFFKRWLVGKYFETTGKAPNSDAIGQTLGVLEAKAVFEGPEYVLSLRVAEHDGAFWYDLGDEKWRALKITAVGYEIVNNPPIIFRRFKNTAAQVEPVLAMNGIFKLLGFVNLKSGASDGSFGSFENQSSRGEALQRQAFWSLGASGASIYSLRNLKKIQILLLVYLVASYVPGIPHPVVDISGEKGAAKSTFQRILRKLVDPANMEIYTMPTDKNELALNLTTNYFASYDNLDGLSSWQSDMLCGAATGSGVTKRELYSDMEEVILKYRRCICLNGINSVSTRADLLDRGILFKLNRIDPENRIDENEFWTAFEEARPEILGSVFNILSRAMAIFPTVKLNSKPRMADFAKWGYAIGEAMGEGGGQLFLDAYYNNIHQASEEAISSSPVASAVMAFMADKTEWEGTMTSLLRHLDEAANKERINTKAKGWPKAAHILTKRLKLIKSNLADVGIQLEITRKENNLSYAVFRKSTPSKLQKVKSSTMQSNQGFQGRSFEGALELEGSFEYPIDDEGRWE